MTPSPKVKPMTRRPLAAALLPLCLALAAAAADLLPIDRLAPKDSWLVMGIDDFDHAGGNGRGARSAGAARR